MTQAAALLRVTPSALSHRLRDLERRVGYTLFTRVGRRLRMTPAAERLRDAAVRTLPEIQRAIEDARQMSRGMRHVVRIGVATYSAFHWLPGFVRHLQAHSPEVEIELVADAARRPLAALEKGDIDLAIVPEGPERRDIRRTPLFEDELLLAMSPGHHLTAHAFIEAEDLIEETYLTYSMAIEPGHEHDRMMRPAGAYPRRLIKVELPEAIIELIAADMGVSTLAAWVVVPHVAAGKLRTARLTAEGIRQSWFAATRRRDDKDAPASRIAQLLAGWWRPEAL